MRQPAVVASPASHHAKQYRSALWSSYLCLLAPLDGDDGQGETVVLPRATVVGAQQGLAHGGAVVLADKVLMGGEMGQCLPVTHPVVTNGTLTLCRTAFRAMQVGCSCGRPAWPVRRAAERPKMFHFRPNEGQRAGERERT
jgi:hypothetical protein